MILVSTTRLWCSLSVHGAGLRIEAMRFGLLIVLTVGLMSVAFRIHSHDTGSQARSPSRPATSPSTQPQSVGTPSATATATKSPPASPSSGSPAAAPHSRARHGHPGPGQPGSADGQQILPVTGWDSAMRLGALAFLLIGCGTLAVRVGSPRRQPGETVQD